MEDLEWRFRFGDLTLFGYGPTAEVAKEALQPIVIGRDLIVVNKGATLIKSNVLDPNRGKEKYTTEEGEIAYK